MLYIRFMGGGGYGDPIDRDPVLVLEDVCGDLVSVECGRDIYGVLIDVDKRMVDVLGTKKQRESIRKARLTGMAVRITDQAVTAAIPLIEGVKAEGIESLE